VVSNSGNYTAIIGNANGCTAVATSSVVSNTAALTASLTNNGPLTCAQTSVTLTASGGTSYTFTEGETVRGTPGSANTLVVNRPGPYSVRVANASGCVSTTSTTVGSATAVVMATLTANSSATLSCSQTQATLSASGGDRYVFSGPGIVSQEGSQALVNAAGVYSVTVTNTATGCFSTTSITIYQDNSAPTASLVSSGTLSCAVTSVTLTAAGGGTYRFSNGATQFNGGNTATVSTAGVYSVTVTADNGCSAVASASVTANQQAPSVSISASRTALTCASPTVSLTALGTGEVRWSTGETSPSISVSAAGTYSMTLTSGSSCSATASVTLQEDLAPPTNAQLSSGTLSCSQTSLTLTASASSGVSYRFSGGTAVAEGQTPVGVGQVVVTTAGVYSVTITGANGCSTVAQATVSGNAVEGLTTYYADADGDGFGNPGSTTRVCSSTPPAGYVTNNTDCDDTRKLYADGDGDGYGAGAAVACGVANNTDCNDADAAIIPTSIAAQPQTLTVEEKQAALFSVNATGTSLTYQWYYNGTAPPNELKKETSATLSLKSAKSSDAGTYYVRVTGVCGSVLSAGTVLSVSSRKSRLAAAEAVSPLRVTVLGNPVVGDQLEVGVTGAEGMPLQLQVIDMGGRVITRQHVERAGAVETRRVELGAQSAGGLLLRVSTPTQSRTLRVLKVD
jgi:hypothetical protein